ncbi:MAG: 8-hydroxy-5-deazaflavin:NADPH oxidoreductase [Pseudonocardiales bacterium]|nr:8-hydroxy-5-deazaflavin:NADPH oxidoreductase [Pseudonocardiales bacterium]
MRVAVIGTGSIGSAVGGGLARGGHDVVFGSRHPETASAPEGAAVTDVASAITGADAVLLAIPAGAVGEFLAENAAALDGLLILDATNNIGSTPVNAAEQILAAAPGARYARAFNALGWESFADPEFDGGPPDLFFSTASADDRAAVEELITAVGLRPAYLGAGQQDVVDTSLGVWIALIRDRGNRRVAFRVLEK